MNKIETKRFLKYLYNLRLELCSSKKCYRQKKVLIIKKKNNKDV